MVLFDIAYADVGRKL